MLMTSLTYINKKLKKENKQMTFPKWLAILSRIWEALLALGYIDPEAAESTFDRAFRKSGGGD